MEVCIFFFFFFVPKSQAIATRTSVVQKSFGGWGLRIDGVEVSEDPKILLQRGDFNHVPVIIGANMDVRSPSSFACLFLFSSFLVDIILQEVPGDLDQWRMTESEYAAWLQSTFTPKYGASFATSLASVYTVGASGLYQTPWYAIQALLTHETFTCASRRNSRWMSAYTDVYHYEFQQAVGIIDFLLSPVGVL